MFTNDARLNWFYKLFSREGFRHCELLMSIGECSVGVCHTLENIEVNFFKEPVLEAVRKLKAKGHTILYLQVEKKPRKLKLGILIPSCVGMCQLFTGVSFHVITPYGYYKALKRYGAREI